MKNPRTRVWLRPAVLAGGVIALAAVVAVSILGFAGYRMMRTLAAQAADPSMRNELAMQLLGATELPSGYLATGSLSLPLVGDIVVLEDRAARFTGLGHAFLYLQTRQVDRRLPFGPGSDDPFEPLLGLRGFEIVRSSTIATGELDLGERKILYEAIRGRLERFPPDTGHVVVALVEITCEEFRKRRRVAVWMGPDPAPDQPPDSVQITGTTADPEKLRSFIENFELCRGGT